jgi:hypothetical protein
MRANIFRCSPNNGHRQAVLACPKSADIVAKVFFGRSTKILKTADAFRVWRHEGPHPFIPKRPPTFVLAPESLATAGASKNRFREILRVVRFSTFATISARNGHTECGASCLLSGVKQKACAHSELFRF